MEQCSETSAHKIQATGNLPKERIQENSIYIYIYIYIIAGFLYIHIYKTTGFLRLRINIYSFDPPCNLLLGTKGFHLKYT